jgi:general stress protein 26
MKKDRALTVSLELMDLSEACYLTTIDNDGYPQTRAMLNLRNGNQFPGLIELFNNNHSNFLVYFTTNLSSQKVVQIRLNPAVSVYYCKPDEWRGLMLGGDIEMITKKEIKDELWQSNWNMYYPKGPEDPDYTILSLKPKIVKLYHQFDSYTIYLEQ